MKDYYLLIRILILNHVYLFVVCGYSNLFNVSINQLFIILNLFHLDPWTILFGKSRQMKYFHNQANRTSIQSAPSDSSHVALLRSIESVFYFTNIHSCIRLDQCWKIVSFGISTFMMILQKNRNLFDLFKKKIVKYNPNNSNVVAIIKIENLLLPLLCFSNNSMTKKNLLFLLSIVILFVFV